MDRYRALAVLLVGGLITLDLVGITILAAMQRPIPSVLEWALSALTTGLFAFRRTRDEVVANHVAERKVTP